MEKTKGCFDKSEQLLIVEQRSRLPARGNFSRKTSCAGGGSNESKKTKSGPSSSEEAKFNSFMREATGRRGGKRRRGRRGRRCRGGYSGRGGRKEKRARGTSLMHGFYALRVVPAAGRRRCSSKVTKEPPRPSLFSSSFLLALHTHEHTSEVKETRWRLTVQGRTREERRRVMQEAP